MSARFAIAPLLPEDRPWNGGNREKIALAQGVTAPTRTKRIIASREKRTSISKALSCKPTAKRLCERPWNFPHAARLPEFHQVSGPWDFLYRLFLARQLQFGRLRGSPRSPLGAPSRSTKMATRHLSRWRPSRKPGSSAFLFRQPSAGRALPAARRLLDRWRQRSEFLAGAAFRSDAFTKDTSTLSGWWRPMGALRSAPGWPTRRGEERYSAFGLPTRTRRACGFVLREAL